MIQNLNDLNEEDRTKIVDYPVFYVENCTPRICGKLEKEVYLYGIGIEIEPVFVNNTDCVYSTKTEEEANLLIKGSMKIWTRCDNFLNPKKNNLKSVLATGELIDVGLVPVAKMYYHDLKQAREDARCIMEHSNEYLANGNFKLKIDEKAGVNTVFIVLPEETKRLCSLINISKIDLLRNLLNYNAVYCEALDDRGGHNLKILNRYITSVKGRTMIKKEPINFMR